MLDIKKILKRSWHILWNYRTLWVFGFILALALGTGNFGGDNSRYSADGDRDGWGDDFRGPHGWQGFESEPAPENLSEAFALIKEKFAEVSAQYPVEFEMGIAVAVTLFVTVLIVNLIVTIMRYVAENAAIRMVDEYEQSGVKVGFRQGWKYGWSRSSWRLFFMDVIVHLPTLFMFVLVVLVAWWIISSALSGVESAIFSSLIAGIGLVFLFGFITVILMIVLYVVRDLAWRISILEGLGVMQSLREASALVKRQWKNVGILWLVMLGLQIAWGLGFLLLMLPLLVISIITTLGGILVAILPTLATAGIASLLSAPDYWPWVFAAIIGLPLFLVVTFSPVILVSGWGYIFQSSTWTVTYRELKAIETVKPESITE
jgi:hypothetical protein